jgi:hypothetical protein
MNTSLGFKSLVAVTGFGVLLTACDGPFVAKTVSEAFTRFPGSHSIVVNANADVDVPLSANDSLVVIGNANTFIVNGASVPGQVGAFVNPFNPAPGSASTSSAAPQAVCVGAETANAKVKGTQTSFVLHMNQTARDAFKTAFDAVCQANGAGGCTNSATTAAAVYTVVGKNVPIPAGTIALRSRRSDTAKGDPSAPFQTVNRVQFDTVPSSASSVTVEDGAEVYLMNLNDAAQVASPQCLPATNP